MKENAESSVASFRPVKAGRWWPIAGMAWAMRRSVHKKPMRGKDWKWKITFLRPSEGEGGMGYGSQVLLELLVIDDFQMPTCGVCGTDDTMSPSGHWGKNILKFTLPLADSSFFRFSFIFMFSDPRILNDVLGSVIGCNWVTWACAMTLRLWLCKADSGRRHGQTSCEP